MKKNKSTKTKKLIAIGLAAVLAFSTLLGALAYFTDFEEALNTITMGKVDITLDENMTDPGNPDSEIPFENPDHVMPGDKISKIVTVTNEKDSAYIRIKVEYPTTEGDPQLTYANLGGYDADKWERVSVDANTDYFYYKTAVATNEVIKLFDSVLIPAKWNNVMSLDSFSINVTAEAIQSANIEIPEGQNISAVWDTLNAPIIKAEA